MDIIIKIQLRIIKITVLHHILILIFYIFKRQITIILMLNTYWFTRWFVSRKKKRRKKYNFDNKSIMVFTYLRNPSFSNCPSFTIIHYTIHPSKPRYANRYDSTFARHVAFDPGQTKIRRNLISDKLKNGIKGRPGPDWSREYAHLLCPNDRTGKQTTWLHCPCLATLKFDVRTCVRVHACRIHRIVEHCRTMLESIVTKSKILFDQRIILKHLPTSVYDFTSDERTDFFQSFLT